MVQRVVQRYLVAVVAFAVALLWAGLGLTSGFECLAVFSLAYAGMGLMQQRRRASTRASIRAREDRRPRTRERRPLRAGIDPDGGEGGEWPLLAEPW